MRAPALALAALLCAAAALVGGARAQPVPIDSSVVILFMSDVEGASSPCMQMVDKVKQYKGRAVNFVVTGYYSDVNKDMVPEGIGYKESQWDKSYKPYTWAAVDRMTKGLVRCMRHAVDANLNIVAHIHLDDGSDSGTWRNALKFNPVQKYGQLSYLQALVKPVATAIKEANWRKRDVSMSMQAEMGATLFYYPNAYRGMIFAIKNAIAKGGTPRSKIHVGVNVNWEKICGCPSDLMEAVDYMSSMQSQWARVKNEINVPAVQALFRSVDWIGISAYAPQPEYLTANDLELSASKVDQELQMFGMSLNGLGKAIVMSEYGMGGGQSNDYNQPATSGAGVAAAPFWGVSGVYTRSRDPWQQGNTREFLRRFYRATSEFAKKGGGPRYRIRAIYIWNIISYDVLGVHYMSASPEGTYRDGDIASLVTAHNAGLRGR